MPLARRQFLQVTAAAVAARASAIEIAGVRIGNMTFSFRDLPLPEAIRAQSAAGIGYCELDFTHLERALGFTGPDRRRKLREWRLTAALEEYRKTRRLFEEARVPLWGLIYSIKDDFTDEEIERGFQFARALGVGVMTGSSTVSVIPRIAPFAEKYGIPFGVHNHSHIENSNEFATPESLEKAMAVSKAIGVNLDVGHFFAAGYDAVDWIRRHHSRITNIDLCDRKPNQGDQTAWGEGGAPLREVLLLMKRERYPFPATIQYQYAGKSDSLTEVRRCLAFCRRVLEG